MSKNNEPSSDRTYGMIYSIKRCSEEKSIKRSYLSRAYDFGERPMLQSLVRLNVEEVNPASIERQDVISPFAR
jgi:hypothetical protein